MREVEVEKRNGTDRRRGREKRKSRVDKDNETKGLSEDCVGQLFMCVSGL